MSVVLGFLVLGMIEISRAVMAKEALNAAARSACRIAIQPTATKTSITTEVNEVLSANSLDTTKATATILVNDKNVDISTAQRGDKITVTVSMPVTSVTWTASIFMSSSTALTESVVMMRQR